MIVLTMAAMYRVRSSSRSYLSVIQRKLSSVSSYGYVNNKNVPLRGIRQQYIMMANVGVCRQRMFMSTPSMNMTSKEKIRKEHVKMNEGYVMTINEYHKIADETLDELTEYFENVSELIGRSDYDVSFSNGVLTIELGDGLGTYVINKQAPNKQLWLSSPVSGPKRYTWEPREGVWVYSQELDCPLHELLTREFSVALNLPDLVVPAPLSSS